jgi:hypothetical protein
MTSTNATHAHTHICTLAHAVIVVVVVAVVTVAMLRRKLPRLPVLVPVLVLMGVSNAQVVVAGWRGRRVRGVQAAIVQNPLNGNPSRNSRCC